MLNPFFSMLGMAPQMGQQQPYQGGAGYWLGQGFAPQQPSGGFLSGLQPWNYQVPQVTYQPGFLDVPPAVPPVTATQGQRPTMRRTNQGELIPWGDALGGSGRGGAGPGGRGRSGRGGPGTPGPGGRR